MICGCDIYNECENEKIRERGVTSDGCSQLLVHSWMTQTRLVLLDTIPPVFEMDFTM